MNDEIIFKYYAQVVLTGSIVGRSSSLTFGRQKVGCIGVTCIPRKSKWDSHMLRKANIQPEVFNSEAECASIAAINCESWYWSNNDCKRKWASFAVPAIFELLKRGARFPDLRSRVLNQMEG